MGFAPYPASGPTQGGSTCGQTKPIQPDFYSFQLAGDPIRRPVGTASIRYRIHGSLRVSRSEDRNRNLQESDNVHLIRKNEELVENGHLTYL